MDTVFNKGTTLPAKRVVTYHADHTIRPSEPDGYIAIKLYEGETFSDPTAKSIVGVLTIKATDVPRPVAEGAEIELTVEIDTSRLIKVTAFIPSLNFFVERGIYLPERDKEDVLRKRRGSLRTWMPWSSAWKRWTHSLPALMHRFLTRR